MVRAPCCEKMGLKKGPWTRDEDQSLFNHVTLHGHENWRALPKQAGLLRCGKSCRLRWINYLRPDIKRGNFSEEEEETIISLHQLLGNRWSAIAARLPGRTDNEIKNVWHTHLKKKMKKIQATAPVSDGLRSSRVDSEDSTEQSTNTKYTTPSSSQSEEDGTYKSNSTQQSSSTTLLKDNNLLINAKSFGDFLEVDDTFWSQVFSAENSDTTSTSDFVGDYSGTATSHFNGDMDFDLLFLDFDGNDSSNLSMNTDATDIYLYNMLTNSSGELPEF